MKVLIPVANGSESLETVALVNVLRRGELHVSLASIGRELQVAATRGITLTADALYSELAGRDFDAIILPGGEDGARALAQCAPLIEQLRRQRLAHRWFGGICAAPALVLAAHGLLDGKQATCYPSFREQLLHWVDQPVVVDGHCITSQGPATAIAFGLELLARLSSPELSRRVAKAMLAEHAG